jgi:mono/diheme cytochrome c family protein
MLAAAGNCRGCHTTPDGRAFAGGVGIKTPFGTVYSTNITPDSETGLGRWSEAAFARAMREGLDREGRHLYPAFPYDHFTRVTDEDNRALYAYLMSRTPVHAEARANELVFPFNIRAGIGVWKRLYFRPGAFEPDAAKDARWNRGAYLAEGLGHCGSCHTPRNKLGAEESARAYDGGDVEGWHAYAINAKNQARVPWDEESLFSYLRRGFHERHGVSRGPMAAVTGDLAQVPEEDVRAIAAYFVDRMRGRQPVSAPKNIALKAAGLEHYAASCAPCHENAEPVPFGGLPLGLSIGVTGESPRNFVIVTLYGIPAAEGRTSAVMPGFATALSDAQVVELAQALRARLTDLPPWPDVEKVVREVRAEGAHLAQEPAGGAGTDPATRPTKR